MDKFVTKRKRQRTDEDEPIAGSKLRGSTGSLRISLGTTTGSSWLHKGCVTAEPSSVHNLFTGDCGSVGFLR
jgi:predicted aconitase with swiveling domain